MDATQRYNQMQGDLLQRNGMASKQEMDLIDFIGPY